MKDTIGYFRCFHRNQLTFEMQRVPADMNVLYLFSIKVLRLKQYVKEKTLRYQYTVEALVSDHLGNSEKWSQLELVAYENLGSRKRPHDETIESGRLQELLA